MSTPSLIFPLSSMLLDAAALSTALTQRYLTTASRLHATPFRLRNFIAR
jgi:hypothetical protein